jgi:triacylglycerol lipase
MTDFQIFSDISKFAPLATQYSARNALVLADAARLAYQKKTVAESIARNDWKLDNFAFVGEQERSTQAIVMGNRDYIIVAFRGTEPEVLQDWITDAKFLAPRKISTGKVHRGFLEGLQAVWPQVKERIGAFQDKVQSLWFTGHSLGAALAALAVADLRLVDKRPVHGLYTFGQPRLGDADFARAFDADFKSKAFRFVNNNDIVTRVPPRALGYSHIGRLLYFDADHVLQDDIGFWERFLDRIKGLEDDFGKKGPDNVKDHGMDGYAELLSRNMAVQLG